MPTILGANKNEGTIFLLFNSNLTTDAAYAQYVEAAYPGHGADIVARYPSATFGSPKAAAAEVFGDSVFVCPTRRLSRALAKGGAATYLYHFVHALPTQLGPELGVFHSSEIPFIFGNTYLGATLSPEEKGLSKLMVGYWSRMASEGDPNGPAAPAWQRTMRRATRA